MSPFETQLREFIRRLNLAEADVRANKRRAVALAQGVRDYNPSGSAGAPQCVSVLKGQVWGCLGTPLANSVVRFVGSTSGKDYGTWPADDGTFEVGFLIEPYELLNVFVRGPSDRFDEIPSTGNPRGGTQCFTYAWGRQYALGTDFPITPNPDNGIKTGYSLSWYCNVPLKSTLQLEDSRRGVALTVTNPTKLGNTWFGADGAVPYQVDNGVGSSRVTVGNLPGTVGWTASMITSGTCPDGLPGGSLFERLFTWSGPGLGPYVAGDTIRVWES